MSAMKWKPLRIGIIALVLIADGLLTWAITALRGENVLTLQACLESESGVRAWVCQEALFKLHPTHQDMEALNASAGAQFPVSMENRQAAARLLRHYLDAGLDINAIDQRSSLKWTALHEAAFAGNLQAVRLLIENGANPDAKDASGRTPLDIAHDTAAKAPSAANTQIISILTAAGTRPESHFIR